MIKTVIPSIDLDQLLSIAKQRGCACNQLFDGLCLAHYAEQQRGADPPPRGYAKRSNPRDQEEFYVHPAGKQDDRGRVVPDGDASRVPGNRRGNGDRPASPVRNRKR